MNAFIRDLQTYVTLHERLAKLLPWRDGGELLAVAKAIIAAQEGYENVLNTVVVGDGKTTLPFPKPVAGGLFSKELARAREIETVIHSKAGRAGVNNGPKRAILATSALGQECTLHEAIIKTLQALGKPIRAELLKKAVEKAGWLLEREPAQSYWRYCLEKLTQAGRIHKLQDKKGVAYGVGS
jgi:hypothetical protein